MYAALFQREALLQALRERGADLNAAAPLGNSVESRRAARSAPADGFGPAP